jgi:hypothetical protein
MRLELMRHVAQPVNLCRPLKSLARASDGFGGWSDAGGYYNPNIRADLPGPHYRTASSTLTRQYPTPVPQERTGALWAAGPGSASVAAIWNQYQASDPYRLMQTMAEYGISAQELGQASGQSQDAINLYLSRAGAPVGFAGGNIIDRDAVNSAFITAADAYLRSVAPDPNLYAGMGWGGMAAMAYLNEFIPTYVAQDTPASRDFVRLYGANFQVDYSNYTPGGWFDPHDNGQWQWSASQLHAPQVNTQAQTAIKAYLSYSQASAQELLAADFTLKDEISQALLTHFGDSGAQLPQTELAERMRARYGSERATQMWRIQLASAQVRSAFAQSIEAQFAEYSPEDPRGDDGFRANSAQAQRILQEAQAQGQPGVVIDGAKTLYTSPSHPWWSVLVHSEYDNNYTIVQFDLQAYTDWYCKQDSAASSLFKELYGSQVTTVVDSSGAGDSYQESSRQFIGAGGAAMLVLRAPMGPSFQVGNVGLHASGIDLRGGGLEPGDLFDPSAITFDPVMGFITANENIDTSHWTDAIPALFVGAVAGALIGPWAATQAGFGGNAIAIAGFGAAAGSMFSGMMTNGRIDLKSVLKSAVSAMLTAGFAEYTNLSNAGISMADGARVVDWATRLPAIGGAAVFNGLVSELMGGKFSQGFAQSLASQLGREIMSAVNSELRTNSNLTAQEQAAYNLMGRSISAALSMAANPNNPMQALAMGFISDIGAALGGEISNLNAGSPNRVAFDDEGNLMPGVVNPNATEAQQRSQLYNQLRAQGMSPAQANQLVQDWVSSGGQAAFNAGGASGAVGGTTPATGGTSAGAGATGSTPTTTRSPVFDDEGYLMPGVVDPNASPQMQRQQIYNALIEQGFSPQDAQGLTVRYFTMGSVEGWTGGSPGTGSTAGTGTAATAPSIPTASQAVDGLILLNDDRFTQLINSMAQAGDEAGLRALAALIEGEAQRGTANANGGVAVFVQEQYLLMLQRAGQINQALQGLAIPGLQPPDPTDPLWQGVPTSNGTSVNWRDLVNIRPADWPDWAKGLLVRLQISAQELMNYLPLTTLPIVITTGADLLIERAGQERFRNGLIDQERANNPSFNPTGTEAHHIIPVREYPELRELRDRLQQWGININDLDNGVLLPVSDHRLTQRNTGYRDAIRDAFSGVTSAAGARVVLQDIKEQLRNGGFTPPRP